MRSKILGYDAQQFGKTVDKDSGIASIAAASGWRLQVPPERCLPSYITWHHRGPQSLPPFSRVLPSANVSPAADQKITTFYGTKQFFPCSKEDVVVPQHKTTPHTCSSNILFRRVRIFAKSSCYLRYFVRFPSVKMYQCGPHWTNFCEILYWGIKMK
jgi:hypothetical protein